MHPFLPDIKKINMKQEKKAEKKQKKEAAPQRFLIVKATAPCFLDSNWYCQYLFTLFSQGCLSYATPCKEA